MERLFNLDLQLLHDALLLAAAVFVLFVLLSYLLFNPARDMLKKREDRVRDNIDSAVKAKAEAEVLHREYEGRLVEIQKEADGILNDMRKKAQEKENRILANAKEEAAGILARAKKQTELERKKAEDDMKKEMITVASMIADKVVVAGIDRSVQDALIEDTLKEIGELTWQIQ